MADDLQIKITVVSGADAKSFNQTQQQVSKLGKAGEDAGKQAAKGLEGMKKPLDSLKGSATQLFSTFGAQGSGLAAGVFSTLKSAFSDIKTETGSLNSLFWASGQTLAAVGAIGVGAVVGLIAVAKKAADAFAGWASQVKVIQSRTGSTAEDASRLTFILGHLGIDTTAAAQAFQIFGRNVTQSSPALRSYFSAAEMAQLAHGDLIKQLPVLQAKYKSLTDAQAQSTFVMAAFGRGGAALRPLLSLTADEMARLEKQSDRLGLTLTQQGINNATQYKRSLNDLGLAFKGLAVQSGQKLVPEFTQGINSIVSLIEKINQADTAFQRFYEHNQHNPIGGILKGSDWLNFLGGAKEADSAINKIADDSPEATQAIADLQSTTLGAFNANRAYERAVQGVSDAQYSLGEAQRQLSKLQKEGAVDAKEVAQAHKGVEQAARGVEQAERGIYDADHQLVSAHRGVEQAERSLVSAQEQQADSARGLVDAQQALIDAQEKLAEVQKGSKPLDLEEAQLRVAEATTGRQRADQRLAQAQTNLSKVQKDRNSTALDIADAELSVQEASQGVTAADLTLQRAQEDLNTTIDYGKEGSDAYTQALNAVQDATRQVEQAQRSQRDAAQAVNDAQYALVESAGAVEQAQYGQQQAALALKDAQDSVTEANQKLREAEAGDPDFADRLASARRNVAQAERALTDARLDAGAAALSRADAEQKEADALLAAGQNAGVVVAKLAQLRAQNPQFASFFDQLIKLMGAAFAGIPGSPYAGPPVPGRVPGFQSGGVVPGPVGRPMYAVVHGGETVVPAGTTTGNTYVVNVYPQGLIVRQGDLGEYINNALLDFQRRGG